MTVQTLGKRRQIDSKVFAERQSKRYLLPKVAYAAL